MREGGEKATDDGHGCAVPTGAHKIAVSTASKQRATTAEHRQTPERCNGAKCHLFLTDICPSLNAKCQNTHEHHQLSLVQLISAQRRAAVRDCRYTSAMWSLSQGSVSSSKDECLRTGEGGWPSRERRVTARVEGDFCKRTPSDIIAFSSLQTSLEQAQTSEQALDLSATLECTALK